MAEDPPEKCISVLLKKIFYGTSLSSPVKGTHKCAGLETSSNAHVVAQDKVCSHHIKVPPKWCHRMVAIETIKRRMDQFPLL